MDGQRFDALARAFALSPSRRVIMKSAISGVFGAVALAFRHSPVKAALGDPCEFDTDCGPNEVCGDFGTCDCANDDACEPNQFCDDGSCINGEGASCSFDLECGEGFLCIEGTCTVSSAQCGDESSCFGLCEDCVGGSCVAQCPQNRCCNDLSESGCCDSDQLCEDSFCRRVEGGGCETDRECITGTICIQGTCTLSDAACNDDSGCPGCHDCVAGSCVDQCADGLLWCGSFCAECCSNSDCVAGELCDSNSGRTCVPAPTCQPVAGDDQCSIPCGCPPPSVCCDDGLCHACCSTITCGSADACIDFVCQPGPDTCVTGDECGNYERCCEGECISTGACCPTDCPCGGCDDFGCFECGCDTDADCGDCESCDEGECVGNCSGEQVCCGDGDAAVCADCCTPSHCGNCQTCRGGACVADCSVGEVCCGSGQICVGSECVNAPECDGAADCGACETCTDGLCVAGCGQDEVCCGEGQNASCEACCGNQDCADCQACVDNVCQDDCSTGDECCDAGFVCEETLCVPEPECEVDADCGACESCSSGSCVSDCTDGNVCCDVSGKSICVECCGRGCPTGEICDANVCVAAPSCGELAVCPEGYVCCEALCAECCDKGDCAVGEVCTANVCATGPATCETVDDCGSAERCCRGECIGESICCDDVDCESGDVCRNGECAAAPTGCETNADCRDCETCIAGSCVDSCLDGLVCCGPSNGAVCVECCLTGCGIDEVCAEHECVPAPPCDGDGDCPLHYFCCAGTCRECCDSNDCDDCRGCKANFCVDDCRSPGDSVCCHGEDVCDSASGMCHEPDDVDGDDDDDNEDVDTLPNTGTGPARTPARRTSTPGWIGAATALLTGARLMSDRRRCVPGPIDES